MNEKQTITAAEITMELIEDQSTEIKELAKKAQAAADAYLADLAQRKTALEKQAADYQAQLDASKKQRKTLAAKINDLSSRGLIDAAADADAQLEALDKSISTLERKLRLVNTAELKGDPKLYKAANEAYAAMVAGQPVYREKIRELTYTVEEEISRLEKLKKELGYALDRNHTYYASTVFTKADRHFRELDRIEREVKERDAAARAEKEKEAKRNCFVFV